MWILIWRPLVLMLGFGGVGAAALATAVINDSLYARVVMGWVLLVTAFQAVVSIGLIVYGAWPPIHRWAEARAAKARA